MRVLRIGSIASVSFVLALGACGGEAPPPAAAPPPTAASLPVAATTPPPAPEVPGHSVDRTAMDPNVKPGTDFFLFANGGWYAKAEIPADRSATGVSLMLTKELEKRTTQLLEDAVKANAP